MVARNIKARIHRQIQELSGELSKLDLLIDSNQLSSTRVRNYTRLTWKNYVPLGPQEFSSIDQYLSFLNNKQYTFILFDGSIMQFIHHFRNRMLIEQHLGFYPSPIPITTEEWNLYKQSGLTLIDFINDNLSPKNVLSNFRLRTPIRFDYDPENARENHPASHLHLCHSECRIPVFAPLSIGHFIHFIFCNFYPELWNECSFLKDHGYDHFADTITLEQKKRLHIGCSR